MMQKHSIISILCLLCLVLAPMANASPYICNDCTVEIAGHVWGIQVWAGSGSRMVFLMFGPLTPLHLVTYSNPRTPLNVCLTIGIISGVLFLAVKIYRRRKLESISIKSNINTES